MGRRLQAVLTFMLVAALGAGLAGCSFDWSISTDDPASTAESTDSHPEGWTLFTAEEFGYSAYFPQEPTQSRIDDGNVQGTRYSFSVDNGEDDTYAVTFCPVSEENQQKAKSFDDDQTKQLLKNMAAQLGIEESDLTFTKLANQTAAHFVTTKESNGKRFEALLLFHGKGFIMVSSADRTDQEFQEFANTFRLI